jgi:hypothetical protein
MFDFVLGPGAVDLILAGVALEAGAVLSWRAVSRRGPPPLALLSNLLAGAFLLLALRNALNGNSGAWIAVCLLAALGAHLADMRWRWRGLTPERSSATLSRRGAATVSFGVKSQVESSPRRR